MELTKLQNELQNIKGGTYYHIEYQSVKDNGYKKITNTTVRNISYGSVRESDTPIKVNPNDTHLGQNIVKYYDNLGNEITKEQWLEANPKEASKKSPTLMFSILVENIIKVGA